MATISIGTKIRIRSIPYIWEPHTRFQAEWAVPLIGQETIITDAFNVGQGAVYKSELTNEYILGDCDFEVI